WHYCGAEHILDVNVGRYYEPRERIVVIHREARPMEHYATVSRARVVVGPPAASLRDHRIAVRPVRCEARTVGRWTPAEAHAQVVHAQEHHAAFEAQNQHRIDANPRIHEAHVKVIETHPQIKAEVNARVEVGHRPGEEHGGPKPGEHVIVPHEPKPAEHPQPPHENHPPEHAQPPHEVRPPEHAQPQPPHQAPPHNAPQPPAAHPAEHPQPARGEHKEEHKDERH
ncbi:MAG TPA: hypothetical protein VHW23_30750, partial [Kofleriaceae bacterium]|nr:hypothetical protein [Kofleriaceae bacterium]